MCVLSNPLLLVVVDAEGSGAAEQGVVHENVRGVIVGVRIPEATCAHSNTFTALFTKNDLNNDLNEI